MADPFELRLFFSNRLKALSPFDDNADEVASFALKHRELDEDLHSCILEQLENDDNNINIRANIIYFLEDLVELAKRERHYPYLCMIERDFPKMIDHAIPLDGLGIVNVNCVRYVLEALHFEHGIFHKETNKIQHNAAMNQEVDTRSFQELEQYIAKRAIEARPELAEPDSENESEPDMTWINNTESIDPMDIDHPISSTFTANVAKHKSNPIISTTITKDQLNQDLHDILSPPGSLSPISGTPIPPTPPSPSMTDEVEFIENNFDVKKPTGSLKGYSPTNISSTNTALTSQPKEEIRPSKLNPISPEPYTPVQQEDANIFLPQYFDFAIQRIEQDRERQRRNEDNSGFVKTGGNVDEEIQHIVNTGKEYIGDVFQSMEAEQKAWKTATEYE